MHSTAGLPPQRIAQIVRCAVRELRQPQCPRHRQLVNAFDSSRTATGDGIHKILGYFPQINLVPQL